VEGFALDLQPTLAAVAETFDDGRPAVTENVVGRGSAVIIGWEASLSCWRAGDTWAEERLVRHALGSHRPPYACDGALVFRLAAPAADHYFLVNDGPARSVALDTRDYRYRAVTDPVDDQELPLGAPIPLDAHSARWLRFEKG
jgi:beta-galactosidase